MTDPAWDQRAGFGDVWGSLTKAWADLWSGHNPPPTLPPAPPAPPRTSPAEVKGWTPEKAAAAARAEWEAWSRNPYPERGAGIEDVANAAGAYMADLARNPYTLAAVAAAGVAAYLGLKITSRFISGRL